MNFRQIDWTPDGAVRLLDQTRLPGEEVFLELRTIAEMIEAIRALRVRGAPLIGVAAAMGLAAAARDAAARGELTAEWLHRRASELQAARPTAVNLSWAVDRMRRVGEQALARNSGGDAAAAALRGEADRIWEEDAAMCRAIGELGAPLVPEGATVLTHCNAGALATGGIGSALGIVYVAHQQGKGLAVVSCETRPLNQGARLTTWELTRSGVPCRAIVDSAAASLMARGEIDLVITGADRIAANGDVANKIGTYAHAISARHHGIPFYVAAPCSTIDRATPDGGAIPIEERSADEVAVAPGVPVSNPAFDVTPAALVDAIVTDRGVVRPPYAETIRGLFE